MTTSQLEVTKVRRKRTGENFQNQTASLPEFPSRTVDMIKSRPSDKLFVKPSAIPTHSNQKMFLREDTEGWFSLVCMLYW